MTCTNCNKEMELEEGVIDYNNPSSDNGHGQYEVLEWVCSCGNTEEYEPEESEYDL